MKNSLKKIWASLLIAMMVVSFMPTLAFGAQETGWVDDYSAYYYSSGGTIVQADHVGSEETEPTCGVAGKVTWTAYDANNQVIPGSVTEVTGKPATGNHTQPEGALKKGAATNGKARANCTESGFYDEYFNCTKCGQKVTVNENVAEEPLGHKAGEPTFAYEGKCADENVEAVVTTRCTVCEEIIDVQRTASDHKWEKVEGGYVAPTCVKEGSQEYKCSECEDVTKTEPIPATGEHKKAEPVKENEVKATCEEKGSYDEVVYCEMCGEELSRTPQETKALGHDWDEGKAVEGEPACTKLYTCKRCGATETRTVDHEYGDKVLARDSSFIAATCLHEGQKVYKPACKFCGAYNPDKTTWDVVTTPVADHDYEWTDVKVEPTCTETGIGSGTCKFCGDTINDGVIPKKAHTPGTPEKDEDSVKDATCTADGSYDMVVKCTVCGTEVKRETVVVPAFGHKYEEVEGTAKEATCTEKGRTADQKCKWCEDVVAGVETPALGHDMELVEESDTCLAKNTRVKKCSRCDFAEVETFAASDHGDDIVVYTLSGDVAWDGENPATIHATSCLGGKYVKTTYCQKQEVKSTEEHDVAGTDIHDWTYTWRTNYEPESCKNLDVGQSTTGQSNDRTCSVCGRHERYWTWTTGGGYGGGQQVTHHEWAVENPYNWYGQSANTNSYDTITVTSDENHKWKKMDNVSVEPTCTEDGKYIYECTECGRNKQEVKTKIGHTAKATKVKAVVKWATSTDSTQADGFVTYTYKCSNGTCETTETVRFSDASGVAKVTYTCADGGKAIWTYTDIEGVTVENGTKAVDYKVPEDFKHNFGDPVRNAEPTVEATCEKDGYYEFTVTCKDCGLKRVVEGERVVINALGHDWPAITEYVVENHKDKTCVQDETCDYAWYCKRCGEELFRFSDVVLDPATGHTPDAEFIDQKVDYTCYEDGSYDRVVVCKVCGEELEREHVVVPAHHDWKLELDLDASTEPTGDKVGVKSYKIVCATCGMVADKYQLIEDDNLDFDDLAEAAGLTWDEMNNGSFDIETMHYNVPVEATGSHDLDKAKAAADEAKKDAAKIDAESYTAKSVKAVADAQAALDAALKTDDAAAIEEATRALNFAVEKAEKKTKSQIAVTDTVLTYTGKEVEMPTPIVLGSTGEVTFKFYDANKKELSKAPVNAGSYFVSAVVAADDNYTAAESHVAKLTVKKAANPMTAKAKTVTAKAGKKTKIAASKAFTVKNNQGKVTYKKMSGNAKIKVSSKGKVTVKKGLTKGKTYKVKVKVKAAGNSNYLSKTKYVYLKVKVVK